MRWSQFKQNLIERHSTFHAGARGHGRGRVFAGRSTRGVRGVFPGAVVLGAGAPGVGTVSCFHRPLFPVPFSMLCS